MWLIRGGHPAPASSEVPHVGSNLPTTNLQCNGQEFGPPARLANSRN